MEKFSNIQFQQPLCPLLGESETGRIVRAVAYTVCEAKVKCVVAPGEVDGSSMMTTNGLIIRAYAPDGQYPMTVRRYVGDLVFTSRFSLLCFLLLHELAHLFIHGGDESQESACDVMAVSLQADFDLEPPRLSRKPLATKP